MWVKISVFYTAKALTITSALHWEDLSQRLSNQRSNAFDVG